MPNPMTGAGYGKDTKSSKPMMKQVYDKKAKSSSNPKKKAMQSMLGSLGSGANFRN